MLEASASQPADPVKGRFVELGGSGPALVSAT